MFVDLLWFLAAAAGCAGLLYVAYRLEPHWVSKDGSRFLTTGQPVDRFGSVIGRRREVRVALLPDGGLMVSRRGIARSTTSVWRIMAKSPKPPRGRHLYLLRKIPPEPDGDLLTLRIPEDSKVVPTLDELVPEGDPGDSSAVRALAREPGSRRWGRRADRG